MSGVSHAAQTGQQPSNNSVPVVFASDQSAIPVVLSSTALDIAITPVPCTVGTVTSITASSSASTLLASNANRQLASFYNNSSQALYMLVGNSTAASATNFTLTMAANSYYETPVRYTGVVSGAWVGASGSALITEYTS